MLFLKYLFFYFILLFNISYIYCKNSLLNKNDDAELSSCGSIKFRNKTNKLIVAGHLFDSVMQLGNGYDSKVLINFFYEIENNKKCNEETLFSDFLRVVIIGSNRRKRELNKVALNMNCTVVTSVIELGEEDATKHWKRLNAKKINSNNELKQLNIQIQKQLNKLHEKGLAHCDIHPDNILLFPINNNYTKINAKLIDFGWSCCFNLKKCGKILGKIVPFCESEEALIDDKINMDGLIDELKHL
ncbi:Protein kinase domain-containing protein [Meloidogyne graminicola]|uniref:Protein kinase domain-containing protein n=1 Tax=Meloidogyne graminicola TaxID=189291 RepID=A0A8S9ZRK7_9BILA|nr:Protein kinase domain-containing protein [Meloidogyne graminicola]